MSLVKKAIKLLIEELTKNPWDGKDQFGNEIANGAYYFHVKAQKDTKVIFEDIFKLAKVK